MNSSSQMNRKSAIKTLLKKVLLLIVPVYAVWVLYIEYMPMYYNRPTNTRWFFIKESLSGKYKIPKVNKVFLGESRLNAGIDITKIPASYSFASGGSSPVEMYYILEKYIQNFSKPDTVFLSVSPRFFCEIFAFWHYGVRNGVVSDNDFREIISLKEKKDTVLGSFPRLKFFLYKADYLSYYQSDIHYNYVFAGYKKNKMLIDTIMKMQGGRPHSGLKDSCSELNYETRYTHFFPSPLLKLYFEKTLLLCEKNKIKLIFFSMPMNKSSFKELSPSFVSDYSRFMKEYKKLFPAFNISDSLYFYPDRYFGDASHLNKKGKTLFTKDFLRKFLSNKN